MKIATTSLLILCVVVCLYCGVETTSPAPPASAAYVGSDKCQSCHAQQFSDYTQSDHFHAMDTALARSVRGDFNNSHFVYYGDTSYFYQRDGKYYVNTRDSAGKKTEFRISFTFGWYPLQQYLVSFPDGRIQTLPFCWDTRPKEEGGQRWFHVYNKEKIPPGDELYWTGVNQNWNYMCADCHTTGFNANFDIASNNFHSSWKETKVSCESCHGPASKHLDWTNDKNAADSLKGMVINLKGKPIEWEYNEADGISRPKNMVYNNTLIETCARCHARASKVSDTYYHGQSFLQTHIPSTINSAHYYIDGQIKDEDYEYASFLQSKMYAKGVTCINCHNPHTMKLKAQGNNVCYSCHAPQKFDVPDHTHHLAGSTGSQCRNCHMSTSTYMVVDDRYDHSFRVPRPDLSNQLGTPNACNKCHADKSVAWATSSFNKWWGSKLPKEKTYGELLYSISKHDAASENALYQLLSSPQYPAIAKATAMEQYTRFLTERITGRVKASLNDADPFMRLTALYTAANMPPESMVATVSPLLNDPVITVRTEAMSTLAPAFNQLDESSKQRFNTVLNEYLTIQRNLGDRPESYLNQGTLLASVGRYAEAEQAYLSGLKRHPDFVPLYGNIADLYRAEKKEDLAKQYLETGIAKQPGNPTLHYAYGLLLFRNGDEPAAFEELKKSMKLDGSNPTFTYGYAVALYSRQKAGEAIAILEKFIGKNGNDPVILDGLISFYREQQQQLKTGYYLDLRKKLYGY